MLKFTALVLAVATALCSASIAQTRYVSTTGSNGNNGLTPGTAWRTLTYAASNAPSGSTVEVAAGLYGTGFNLEGIELTGGKTISFVGAGINETIVRANLGLTKVMPWVATSLTFNGVFFAHGAGTVLNVRGITVDANNLNVDRLCCMMVTDAASAKIQNCEFTNVGNGSKTGNSHIAFMGAGKPGTPSTIEVTRCLIQNWDKSGIVMKGNSLTGIITNNDIIGCGRTDKIAQNAIQLGQGGDKFTVTNNAIRNCWYMPEAWNAVGIIVFDTIGTNLIQYNTILSCKTGYYHYAPTTGSTLFDGNRVANCKWGTNIYSPGSTMTGNDFDADVSVFVFGTNPATLDSNGFSDFRNNSGYPTKYEADGNATVRDTNVKPNCLGFKTSVDIARPNGSAPSSVVTGDFDADGNPDMAVANSGTNLVSIHLGTGGTGFAAATTIAVAGNPSFLTTGEFTGTAGVDLAVVSLDGTVRILKNNGSGVFTASAAFDIDGAANDGRPTSVASGQFNDAFEEDLVVGLKGDGTTKNGGAKLLFVKAGVILGAADLLGFPLRAVYGVAAGDISGNGEKDIVLTDAANALGTSNKLHVYVQFLAGAFTTPVSYSIGPDGSGVALGDLDRDGRLDATCTRSGAPGWVHVFRNIGGGGFLTEANMSPFRVDSGPTEVSIQELQDDDDFDTPRRDIICVHPAVGKVTRLRHYVGDKGPFSDYRGCSVGLDASSIAFAYLDKGPDKGPQIDMIVVDKGDDKIEVHLADPDALAQLYGGNCAGTGGKAPRYFTVGIGGTTQGIDDNSRPLIGDGTWGVGVRNALPNADCIVLFSALSTPSASNCQVQVGALFFSALAKTDTVGTATIVLGVPNVPAFCGFNFYSQWGVADPNGGLFGQFSTTSGVRFRLGLR